MVQITINDKQFSANSSNTVLDVAKRYGIEIPTLCYHPAVEPYGACRLCVVEVSKPSWKGKTKVVVSCAYPVEDELIVYTETAKVVRTRQFVMSLLLNRVPNSSVLQNLAVKLGVKYTYRTTKPVPITQGMENCILCGLCVRVCKENIGAAALTFAYRGSDRKVATPFDDPSDKCIACGACAFVCPTDVIKYEDVAGKRKMVNWHTEREYVRCSACGTYLAPEMLVTNKIVSKTTVENKLIFLCPTCRRTELARQMIP